MKKIWKLKHMLLEIDQCFCHEHFALECTTQPLQKNFSPKYTKSSFIGNFVLYQFENKLEIVISDIRFSILYP